MLYTAHNILSIDSLLHDELLSFIELRRELSTEDYGPNGFK